MLVSFLWSVVIGMDRDAQIVSKNYSAVLVLMILGFIIAFLVATVIGGFR